MNKSLREAYERTSYRVCHHSRTLTIRIGVTALEIEPLLGKRERTWLHVTAWNPRSKKLSKRENDARQAALEQLLLSLGHRVLPGWGVSENGKWFERHCFAAGVSRERALLIGRLFEQNAIVVGERGKPAELVELDLRGTGSK
ncbi:MAG: DUF3293 domain-containing protein [Deltaproteobacteria bacterium]|nr:DUF3293 domain-containing protein [Deltaproteobacteria bacterium]